MGGWILGSVLLGPFALFLFAGSMEVAFKSKMFMLGFAGLLASALIGYFLLVTLILTSRHSSLWAWHCRTGLQPPLKSSGFGKGFFLGLLLTVGALALAMQILGIQSDKTDSYTASTLIVFMGLGGFVFSLFNGYVVTRWRMTQIPKYNQYGPD